MRVLRLRWKNRRHRWMLKWLDRRAQRRFATTWTDHYTHPITSGDAPYRLYVEVVSTKFTYGFGKDIGMRVNVKMMVLTVTEYLLTGNMEMVTEKRHYFGLRKSELFTLLQRDLPWLKDLPNGNIGENRLFDRRPPKHIG